MSWEWLPWSRDVNFVQRPLPHHLRHLYHYLSKCLHSISEGSISKSIMLLALFSRHAKSVFKYLCIDITVIFLSFRTDRSGQSVQTQIRLLLEEQADQGLHCLLFSLHLWYALPLGNAILFNFKGDYSKFSGLRNFRILTVIRSYFKLQPIILSNKKAAVSFWTSDI